MRTLKSGKVWESFYYNGRDATGRRVQLSSGDALPYDVLSVNVEPVVPREKIEEQMPGARRNALFTRPLENFVQLWPQLQSLAQERALQVAVELLNQTEGYSNYDKFQQGAGMITTVIRKARAHVAQRALDFAEEYKNDSVIYTMGSGAGYGAAYMESICIFMEMQWINSGCIHSGEYFHGPFEVTDYDVPFMLVKSIGHTRHLDERVENFAKKFTEDLLVLDQKDLDLSTVADEAKPYVAAILTGVVIRHFVEAIAFERGHSLDVRRYMWQMQY